MSLSIVEVKDLKRNGLKYHTLSIRTFLRPDHYIFIVWHMMARGLPCRVEVLRTYLLEGLKKRPAR